MSALPTAAQLSLPPPIGFRLQDGTGAIGWIVENRIEFTGFADPTEAAHAAWIAHVALERRRARSRREPAPYIESPSLTLVREGQHEWIQATGKRIGRLVRPEEARVSTDSNAPTPDEHWFGMEIALAATASELFIGSSAHVIYLGLRRSGLRWSLRARAGALSVTKAPANEAVVPTAISLTKAPPARHWRRPRELPGEREPAGVLAHGIITGDI